MLVAYLFYRLWVFQTISRSMATAALVKCVWTCFAELGIIANLRCLDHASMEYHKPMDTMAGATIAHTVLVFCACPRKQITRRLGGGWEEISLDRFQIAAIFI